MKELLFLTQHYYPEKIGSAPYITEISEWLSLNNFHVEVITNRPFYPNREINCSYRNGKKDYEHINNIYVQRVKPYIGSNNILSRALSNTIFFFRAWKKTIGFKSKKVISLCPSIFTVALGNLQTEKNGIHLAIIHDIESSLAKGLNISPTFRFLYRLLCLIEKKVLNRVTAVIVLTEGMKQSLVNIGVQEKKIHILPIWVEIDEPDKSEKDDVTYQDTSLLMYSGNVGKKQGLDQILDLAELLASDSETSHFKILIRGEGNYKNELVQQANIRGLENVMFDGLVPKSQLNNELRKPLLHLVPQLPEGSEAAIPSKIFKIMANSKTFIATAEEGSTLWHLSMYSKGFKCVQPHNMNEMKAIIHKLYKNDSELKKLEKNAFKYVSENHSKKMILEKYFNLINSDN